LADTPDLESGAERRIGSSPISPTNNIFTSQGLEHGLHTVSSAEGSLLEEFRALSCEDSVTAAHQTVNLKVQGSNPGLTQQRTTNESTIS
jgi:hypothetical protein